MAEGLAGVRSQEKTCGAPRREGGRGDAPSKSVSNSPVLKTAQNPFTPQLPQTDASLLRLGRVISEACKRKLGLLLDWHVLLVALGTLLGKR